MLNNNRWSNFNNNGLYDKYKQSQTPTVAPRSQPQQQSGGNQWNDLGNKIGGVWKESMAKRNDGMYNGNVVGGTAGNDAQNYAQMQEMMASNDLGLQNTAYGTTDWNAIANGPNMISAGEPINLGANIGANAMTQAGTDALANAGTQALANAGTEAAIQGGAMAGEAIGAGTAAAEGATTAGAGSALGSVLGPLGAVYGIYSLGDALDWWG